MDKATTNSAVVLRPETICKKNLKKLKKIHFRYVKFFDVNAMMNDLLHVSLFPRSG